MNPINKTLIVQFFVITLLSSFFIPNTSASIDSSIIDGILTHDAEPIESAVVTIWVGDSDDAITTSTGSDGTFSVELDGTLLNVGDQVIITVDYTDQDGDEHTITSCKIVNNLARLYMQINAESGRKEMGVSFWTNDGDSLDDYSVSYEHSGSSKKTQSISTINAPGLTEFVLYITYYWDDSMDLDCDNRVFVDVTITVGVSANDPLVTYDIPDPMHDSYERVDLCSEPDDGQPYTSDPTLNITVYKGESPSSELSIKGRIDFTAYLDHYYDGDWNQIDDIKLESLDPDSNQCEDLLGECETKIQINWF